jgi:hypothetical protein
MNAFLRSLLIVAAMSVGIAQGEVKLGNEVLAARHFDVLKASESGC